MAFNSLTKFWWQSHNGWIIFNAIYLLCKNMIHMCGKISKDWKSRYDSLVWWFSLSQDFDKWLDDTTYSV